MVDSISNSGGVLAILQSLQTASADLTSAENRVGTGLKVNKASDAPVAFQTSSVMTGEVNSLKAVTLSLSRAQSISDVSIAAGDQISTLLTQMQGTAASATASDLTSAQRTALNQQFQQQYAQLTQFVQNASFDGANVLDGSKPNGVSFVADSSASETLTLKGRNFLPGGSTVTLSSANDLSSPTAAQQTATAVAQSLTNVGAELADMSTENKRITAQSGFVSQLSDALTAGVGQLVDADVASDSALIQSLKVKQQLSAQAISIANSTPQALLALLRK